LSDIALWLQLFAIEYGYFGSFIISIISNLILFVPIPYLIIIFALSTVLDPLILGLVSALGATIGKIIIYHIGKSGRKILKESQKKKLEFARLIMEKYGPIAIFIMAATPVPDDILYIPLGMMRFDLIRFFIYTLLGKIVLTLIISLGGHFSITWISYLLGGESVWGMMVTIIFIALSVYATAKMDWEALFYKYFSPKETKK